MKQKSKFTKIEKIIKFTTKVARRIVQTLSKIFLNVVKWNINALFSFSKAAIIVH